MSVSDFKVRMHESFRTKTNAIHENVQFTKTIAIHAYAINYLIIYSKLKSLEKVRSIKFVVVRIRENFSPYFAFLKHTNLTIVSIRGRTRLLENGKNIVQMVAPFPTENFKVILV